MPWVFPHFITGTTDVVWPQQSLHTIAWLSVFYLSTEFHPRCLGTLFLAKAFQYSHMKKIWKLREKLECPFWVIFKSHLLEIRIIQYCRDKEGERLHHTLRGQYWDSEFLWYGFIFPSQKAFNFFKCFNWYNIERWVIQVLMLLSVLSQKLLLPQRWPSYKETFSPNSTDAQRIRSNWFFLKICI